MDCSLLRSSVHGIFQARVLEWGVIAFSAKASLGAQESQYCGEHSPVAASREANTDPFYPLPFTPGFHNERKTQTY